MSPKNFFEFFFHFHEKSKHGSNLINTKYEMKFFSKKTKQKKFHISVFIIIMKKRSKKKAGQQAK